MSGRPWRALAVGVVLLGGLALTSKTADAITLYDAGPVAISGANVIGPALPGHNLSLDSAQIEALLGTNGSLTLNTFVTLANPAVGQANVTFFPDGTLTTATVQWGGGPVLNLLTGANVNFSTIFAAAVSQALTFTWTGATGSPQISARIAVNPVPIPGALLLFASGLGGLFALTRRRKKLSPA